MSLLSVLSALALTAPAETRVACTLAPSYGQGSADEGRVDNFTAVALDCGYRAFQYEKLSLWPVVGFGAQNWSIYRDRNGIKEISTYRTQDIQIGARASYAFATDWNVAYTFSMASGKGGLDKTYSTNETAQSESYGRLKHRVNTHSLAVERRLTQLLALHLGVQRQSSTQSWNADRSSFNGESVDADNRLELFLSPTADFQAKSLSHSRHQVSAAELGLTLLIP